MLILVFASTNDRDLFESIYNKYKGLMLRKAYGILNDAMFAEDAVSEAFIRIYKNLHKLETADSPRTASFVYTVVKNPALTILAKRNKTRGEELDENLPDISNLENTVISNISTDHIMEIIDRLGEELKSVFLLSYAHGLPHREIGKLLGISENNVTVRLFRAKKKLSVMLGKEGLSDEN